MTNTTNRKSWFFDYFQYLALYALLGLICSELWFGANLSRCHQLKHFQIIGRNKAIQNPKKGKGKPVTLPSVMKTDCYAKTTPIMEFQKMLMKVGKLGK